MSAVIQGLAVSRGIAIGRAVLVASSRLEVPHYFIEPDQVGSEVARLLAARGAVVADLERLCADMPPDVPAELTGLLEVHLMLLQDETIGAGVRHWIATRLYNAEWAMVTQLDVLSRQFDEMEDNYLRERKADLEQVVDRVLRQLKGVSQPTAMIPEAAAAAAHEGDEALVLVARDLSPADMLQFRKHMFAGFVTDVGGKTSHTAIVARSLDIPAVVGARNASGVVRQDDRVIVDGDAGVLIVDPSPAVLREYAERQRQSERERRRLAELRDVPAVTQDGEPVELLANIEQAGDALAALAAGAAGVGLLRTEFLFMGRQGELPGEEEQYAIYAEAVQAMGGRPVTIRTVDVGADKPLDDRRGSVHLNPALGLRAIRWCLTEPDMFLNQLRAILRAAALGPVQLLIPMLAHASEIRQTLAFIGEARAQLDQRGQARGSVQIGAMIEVPAAALAVRMFLRHFDFLSIGTNDLTQYALAIDRADEAVAHLYDPLHPAVLRMVADTIAEARRQDKPVTVCGEMAGDPAVTGLLLGLGLRSFSMHPAQLLAVKREICQAVAARLAPWAQDVLNSDEPASLLATAPAD